jgi:hypothetical protein
MDAKERDVPRRCPICGEGELVDLAFDERPGATRQTADSREVDVYSCGHETVGPSLASADTRALSVEQRSSDEGVVPPPDPAS